MTLLEGPDHYNGHCTCDRWSYRTADWTDLGTKWAWHYIAESERPDDHPLIRRTVRAEMEAIDNYGGGLPRLRPPRREGAHVLPHLRAGRCRLRGRPRRQLRAQLLLGGHRCRRVARDAAHQRVACRNCGNCLDCDEPDSPDHEDCICPLGQALPVEVAA